MAAFCPEHYMHITRTIIADVVAALESEPDLASRLRMALGLAVADRQLSHREAAHYAGVTLRMIRDRLGTGEIAGTRGRHGTVARAELDRWIATRHQVPRPPESGDVEVAASLAAAADRMRRRPA